MKPGRARRRQAMRDLKDELAKWTPGTGEGETWKPLAGEVLVGRVAKQEVVDGQFGPQTQVLMIEEETERQLTVYIGRKSLVEGWEKEKPQVGDRVAIKYHGEVPTKSGGTFHVYKVMVDHEAPAWEPPAVDDIFEGEVVPEDEPGLPAPSGSQPAWAQGSLGDGGATEDEYEDPLAQ